MPVMDKTRFEAILAAYGADPRRWPEAERAAAQAFARASGDGAAIAEARALDAALGEAAEPAPVSDLLYARVLARAPKPVRRLFERGQMARPLMALAACAVFGLALGFGGGMLAPASIPQDSAEAIIASAFQGAAFDLETLGFDG